MRKNCMFLMICRLPADAIPVAKKRKLVHQLTLCRVVYACCRRRGMSLAPNVSLSRQPFVRLQQQLMKLEPRDADWPTNHDLLDNMVTDDDVTDDVTDTESTSSDRCK